MEAGEVEIGWGWQETPISNEDAERMSKLLGISVRTVKRYARGFKARIPETKGHPCFTGYEDPYRQLAAEIINTAIQDGDLIYLHSEEASFFIEMLTEIDASEAIVRLHNNGYCNEDFSNL